MNDMRDELDRLLEQVERLETSVTTYSGLNAELQARLDWLLRELCSAEEHRDLNARYCEEARAEGDRLREALNMYAAALERDWREPDKVLCNALSMRRAAQI